jgi:hypothetical protein
MPKKRVRNGSLRISRAEAEKLYPNEWIVFSDPSESEDGTFKDGVVFFHGKDQAEAYKMSSKVKGDRATYYTGEIPFDKHGLNLNDRKKAAA